MLRTERGNEQSCIWNRNSAQRSSRMLYSELRSRAVDGCDESFANVERSRLLQKAIGHDQSFRITVGGRAPPMRSGERVPCYPRSARETAFTWQNTRRPSRHFAREAPRRLFGRRDRYDPDRMR